MILCRFFSLFHVFFSFVLQISARLFKVQVSGQSDETYRGPMDGRRFLNWVHLLKFATMMGMGKVMQSTCWTNKKEPCWKERQRQKNIVYCSTPQMAQREPTSFPPAVVGAMSPYPEQTTFLQTFR